MTDLERLVSIHAPAWGATMLLSKARRDDAVSIHAPAWGATDPQELTGMAGNVSIHAPAWGATSEWQVDQVLEAWFQSTHPRGVRRFKSLFHGHHASVSIHAPAWGATSIEFLSIDRLLCFNPRTRVGCDPMLTAPRQGDLSFNPRTRVGCDFVRLETARAASMFQSTHPRGVRRWSYRQSWYSCHCFNPRTRVGCDCGGRRRGHGSAVSIHAPAWGATTWVAPDRPSNFRFQSTHPRGVRLRGESGHVD